MNMKWCNRCHRKIEIPEMIKKTKFDGAGKIKIGCGNCKKGFVLLKANELK